MLFDECESRYLISVNISSAVALIGMHDHPTIHLQSDHVVMIFSRRRADGANTSNSLFIFENR